MKDLSYLWYFLGIEAASSPRGYLISQSKYIADILERARLTDNKTIDTSVEVNARYSSSDGIPLTDPTLYYTIIGSLIYLTITRPNIAYVVHVVSQFVSSLTTVYWAVVLHILWYLRGTVFQSLLLSSTSSSELCAYSDVDHGSDLTDRKSVTSFCIFISDSNILKEQETIYCFSILKWSRISCYDIYYQGDCLVYVGYLLIWELLFLILLLYIVTTRVLFRLLTTRFFMSELSTLRSIVILLVIISSMTPLLYLLFLLPCRL